MSNITGKWDVELQTPLGKQGFIADLTADDSTVNGTTDSKQTGPAVLRDGEVSGDAFSFIVDLKKPFPMAMSFEFTISGNELTGIGRAKGLPKIKAKGTRLA